MKTQHSSPLRKLPLCAMAVMASVVGFSASANAATLTVGQFQVIGDTNNIGSTNPAISVTPGQEGYSTDTDGFGTGGLDGSFNAAIADYAFYTTGTGSLVESLGGTADLISATNSGGQTSDVDNQIQIWAGSSTAGAADQTTWSRPGAPVGTVDISGLTSGSLYMFFGTRVGAGDTYDITFSLTGAGQTTLNLSEVGINKTSQGGTTDNTWFVYRADFADAAAYDTLNFTYDMTSSNTQARHRWGGVVLTAVPEPSVALIGGLGVLLLLRRRRC